MPETVVNIEALYAALDSKRQAERLSWRDIASHLNVSPSTFTRMAQGRRPDVDTFASLLNWLGMPASAFTRSASGSNSQEQVAEPLAMISSYLRSAKNIRPEDADALEDILRAAYRRLVREK